jgi:hypothetical protein
MESLDNRFTSQVDFKSIKSFDFDLTRMSCLYIDNILIRGRFPVSTE